MKDEHLSLKDGSGAPLTLAQNGQSLTGKVALVSVGGSGKGRELALELAAFGAAIIVADSEIDSAEVTAEAIRAMGGRAIAVAVDLNVKSQVELLVKYASGIFGSVEFVVNQAGNIYKVSGLIDSKESEWEKMLIEIICACKSNN